jgi:hypothetical protein
MNSISRKTQSNLKLFIADLLIHTVGQITKSDREPYVLTELGQQFVHYTMNELTTKLEG